MGNSIATVTGTLLKPGVSRNRRLYTRDNIGRGVDRANKRLLEGGPPLTMRIGHPLDEPHAPVDEIVGRITAIWQESDGRARFRADVANTTKGNDVLQLVDTRDGEPYLEGVSIRGGWLGRVRNEVGPDGALVETADDIEFDGLDYTHKPGVDGARVEDVQPVSASNESAGTYRHPIHESVQEALVTTTIVETAPAVSGDVIFADPGYQKDQQKRLPLDTKLRAKAAWAHITESDNARVYSAAQLKRVKGRIGKALKGFGVQVATNEGWLIEPATAITESAVAECLGIELIGGQQPGSFCVNLSNGPINITVSSWCVDPHDLDAVGRAAMEGACAALALLDPDEDGDIDNPDASANESAPATQAAVVPVVETAAATEPPTTSPTNPVGDGVTERKEPAVSEATTAASGESVAAPATITLTLDQLRDLINPSAAPAAVPAQAPTVESAPAVPAAVVTESEDQRVNRLVAEALAKQAPQGVIEVPAAAPAVVESEDARIARIVEAQVAAERTRIVQEMVANGQGPGRKGLVESTAIPGTSLPGAAADLPEGWPQKPLHEYSKDEWNKYAGPATVAAVLKGRG